MTSRVPLPTESFNGLTLKRQAASCRSPAPTKSNAARMPQFPITGDECLPVDIADAASEYIFTLPLTGLDARSIFILAAPRSLLIEVRFKKTVSHGATGTIIAETIDRRTAREFTLPIEIERNGTTAHVIGDQLQITARKAQGDELRPWSQLVHFDVRTRAAQR